MANKAKIRAEDIKIEILCPSHLSLLSSFSSYERDLVDFLVEDALNNQNQRLSLTFLWFYKTELVSYITLLNDRINLEGDLRDFFMEKGILYKSLPALKIGRLCVHDLFLRNGLGRLMVVFALQIVGEISKSRAGCRFLTLDAKQNSNMLFSPVNFYKKLDFKSLKERKKGIVPMYLDTYL
ncbi:MAG: hypothetical protein V1734_04120 [Nanoarchaeota archaeon]